MIPYIGLLGIDYRNVCLLLNSKNVYLIFVFAFTHVIVQLCFVVVMSPSLRWCSGELRLIYFDFANVH